MIWFVRRCHQMNYHVDPEQRTTNDDDDDTAKDDEGGVAPDSLAVNLLVVHHRREACFCERASVVRCATPLPLRKGGKGRERREGREGRHPERFFLLALICCRD